MTENVPPLYKSAKKEFDGIWREKQPAKYLSGLAPIRAEQTQKHKERQLRVKALTHIKELAGR